MIIQNTYNEFQTTPADTTLHGALNATPKLSIDNIIKQTFIELPSSPEKTQSAISGINRTLREMDQNVEFIFSVDTDNNGQIIKVIDTKTGSLIRQFPLKEMFDIAHSIDHLQKNVLLNEKI